MPFICVACFCTGVNFISTLGVLKKLQLLIVYAEITRIPMSGVNKSGLRKWWGFLRGSCFQKDVVKKL